MGQSIEEYADALYIKKLSDARKKHTQELNEASRQMGQRGAKNVTRSTRSVAEIV